MFKYRAAIWLLKLGVKLLVGAAEKDITNKSFISNEDKVYTRGLELMRMAEGCMSTTIHAESMAKTLVRCLVRVQKSESENCDDK
jgi:predicted ATPase